MEKNKKKIIFFMPSIEGGGVEKNLFIIANHVIKKTNQVSVITFDKKFKSFFDKRIEFLTAKNLETNKKYSKYYKYYKCIILLIKALDGFGLAASCISIFLHLFFLIFFNAKKVDSCRVLPPTIIKAFFKFNL